MKNLILNKKGSAMVAAYLVVVLLLVFGGAFLSRAVSELHFSQDFSKATQALWAAEAGVRTAEWLMNQEEDLIQNTNCYLTPSGDTYFQFLNIAKQTPFLIYLHVVGVHENVEKYVMASMKRAGQGGNIQAVGLAFKDAHSIMTMPGTSGYIGDPLPDVSGFTGNLIDNSGAEPGGGFHFNEPAIVNKSKTMPPDMNGNGSIEADDAQEFANVVTAQFEADNGPGSVLEFPMLPGQPMFCDMTFFNDEVCVLNFVLDPSDNPTTKDMRPIVHLDGATGDRTIVTAAGVEIGSITSSPGASSQIEISVIADGDITLNNIFTEEIRYNIVNDGKIDVPGSGFLYASLTADKIVLRPASGPLIICKIPSDSPIPAGFDAEIPEQALRNRVNIVTTVGGGTSYYESTALLVPDPGNPTPPQLPGELVGIRVAQIRKWVEKYGGPLWLGCESGEWREDITETEFTAIAGASQSGSGGSNPPPGGGGYGEL
ncbi:hypothetical protein ACFL96_06390 [Thermoproteota archaeon]